jgi:hypothetical protein
MPLRYERDDVRRRVVVTVTGSFEGADLVELLDRQTDDGTWTYGFLYDARGMTAPPTINELKFVLERYTTTVAEQGHRGPLALLTTDGVLYKMACTYAALRGTVRPVEVFRDRDEADRWLAQQTVL